MKSKAAQNGGYRPSHQPQHQELHQDTYCRVTELSAWERQTEEGEDDGGGRRGGGVK